MHVILPVEKCHTLAAPDTALVLVAFLLLIAAGAAVPFVFSGFYVKLLATILTYCVWAMSFGLIMGQLGLTTFGHASLFGVGAYVSAYLALNVSSSLMLSLTAGAVVGGMLGALMGVVLGRLNGVAFAIATLAFGGMVYQIANGWIDVTGGSDGLVGLPFPTIGSRKIDQLGLYWCALVLAAGTFVTLWLVMRSRVGMILHAVRDNAARATASGIPVIRVRALTIGAAGVVAGAAGAEFAYIVGSVSPSVVNWTASGDVLVMSILGGVRSIAGPFAGAFVYAILEQALSQFIPNYRLLLGVVFMAIVVLMPEGLSGYGKSSFFRRRL
jgi:branched-chain amino acid transport system permease protein